RKPAATTRGSEASRSTRRNDTCSDNRHITTRARWTAATRSKTTTASACFAAAIWSCSARSATAFTCGAETAAWTSRRGCHHEHPHEARDRKALPLVELRADQELRQGGPRRDARSVAVDDSARARSAHR